MSLFENIAEILVGLAEVLFLPVLVLLAVVILISVVDRHTKK